MLHQTAVQLFVTSVSLSRDGRPAPPRPAPKKTIAAPPRPAPPRKIPLLPSPAPSRPWKWSNCGAFAGQNENSKTLKMPKIFTNAYGQAGGGGGPPAPLLTVSLTVKKTVLVF